MKTGLIIDAHFHVFDPRYPLPGNDGYVPPPFTVADYRAQAEALGVGGGVLVAASTHGLDPAALMAALEELGPGYAAVLNADPAMTEEAMAALAGRGVRGLRHNLYRGAAGAGDAVLALAARARAAGLHAQVYADAAALRPLLPGLQALGEGLVIDHLGMTEAGMPVLLELVDSGAKVKATGFGRVSLDVPRALERIEARRPGALMFGTDIPSTRAERPFDPADIALVRDVLGEAAEAVLHGTARRYYGLAGA